MRGLSFILIAIVIAESSLVYGISEGNDDEVRKNVRRECGADVDYYWNSDTLIIHGSGPMYNFTAENSPWYSERLLLTRVEILSGVTSVGSYAFLNCENLLTVLLGDSVSFVGEHAFHNCSQLSGVSLPSGITSIEDSTFQNCYDLSSVVIPSTVSFIGTSAFEECIMLVDATIPNTVTHIANNAFKNCLNYEANIPSKAVSIGDYAFYATAMTALMVPAGLVSIGEMAFSLCSDLATIEVEADNPYFSSYEGALFDKHMTSLIQYSVADSKDSYTIPDGVISIESYSFHSSNNLINIVIPEGLMSIGIEAFRYCRKLQSITIPDSMTSINNSVFSYCEKLASVELPSNLNYIGSGAFENCKSLADISLPDSVVFIGSRAFSSCTSLTGIAIPEGVTSISDGLFRNCKELVSVKLPTSVTSIGSSSFRECTNLINVTFPDLLQTIEEDAFYNCHSIDNLTLPDGLVSIGDNAFSGCEKVTDLVIPDSVQSVGSGAFLSCLGLEHLALSKSISRIEANTFYGCGNLTEVIIPNGVTYIGDSAFSNCIQLQSVAFPNSLETIGQEAFDGCEELTYVVIPEDVTSIQSFAFFSCSSLESIFYQGSTPIQGDVVVLTKTLKNVCVSPDYPNYDHGTFGSVSTTPDTQLCKEFRDGFNQCFKATYSDGRISQEKRNNATRYENQSKGCARFECSNDTGAVPMISLCLEPCSTCDADSGECGKGKWSELILNENECYSVECDGSDWVMKKRKNATEWEKQTDSCMAYECHNKSGFMSWSLCKSTNDITRLCTEGQCIEKKNEVEEKTFVEIEIKDETKVAELNVTEVIEVISESLGIKQEEISIAYEVDDDGYITRIIVYVKDEETANVIATMIDNIEKGEECQSGILCRSQSVRVTVAGQKISGMHRNLLSSAIIVVFFLFVVLL